MKKYIIILLLVVFIIPSIALASWWNPFSWNLWDRLFKVSMQESSIPQVPNSTEKDELIKVEQPSIVQEIDKKTDSILIEQTTQVNKIDNKNIIPEENPGIPLTSQINKDTSASVTTPSQVYESKSALLDISCVDNRCVAVGNNLIIQSTDAGKIWKTVLSGNIGTKVINLKDLDCIGNLCIGVGESAIMVRSFDGGKNWTVVDNFLVNLENDSFTSNISKVDCIDEKICYAIGENFHHGGDITKFDKAFGTVLLKTTDGGLTWKVEKKEKARFDYLLPNVNQIDQTNMFELKYTSNDEIPLHLMKKISCKNQNECFGIGSSRSIFHTTDGWETVTLQQFKIDDPVRVFSDGNIGYIVDGNTVNVSQKVARYEFSDISFTRDNGVIIEDIGYGPNGGTRVILKSIDNGNTWRNINVPLPTSSTTAGGKISCSESVCVIVSQNTSARRVDILTSLDNGDTWETGMFKKLAFIYGVDCIDSSNCLAVGDTIPKGAVIKVK